MADLRPFRGFRPPPELAPKLASPPYDVVSLEEARARVAEEPKSFLQVTRAEVELPCGREECPDQVHQRAAENLSRFVREGWLVQDKEESFYLYRERLGEHVQTAVLGLVSVDAFDADHIRRHELTRRDKEEERTQHLEAIGGNDEPVLLTYRGKEEIDRLVETLCAASPEYDFQTADGISHTFWRVGGERALALSDLFRRVHLLYVADGHIRSAAASRARQAHRGRGGGPGPQDWFLAALVPHHSAQILPYHRVVRELNGHTPEALLEALELDFEVEPADHGDGLSPHQFGMLLGGGWHRLTARIGTFEESPIGMIDSAILQQTVLGPLLGIRDPRVDARIGFIGGLRGLEELERRVRQGEFAVGFSLAPTDLEHLLAIADAGEIMPPKSTWFAPKPRSGLLVHLY